MKRYFITAVLALLCGIAAAQQVAQQPKDTIAANTSGLLGYYKARWFTIGVKLGYNFSLAQDKINNDYAYSIHTDMRHGGSAGIYMRLGTNVFCQPEVLYTMTVYDESRNFNGDTLLRGMQTHTIDVPVLLGYSPICSETFKFRLMVGPRFAFNVNTIDKYNNVALVDTERFAVSMNKGRLGLDCGIGFDFWKISLDLRYILMEDIFKYQYKNTETGSWNKVNFWISTFNISVGYNIWGNNMPSSRKQKYDPSAYDFFRKDRL